MRLRSRRQFLHAAIGTGGLLGLGTTAWLSGTGRKRAATGLRAVTRESWALGSKATITVLHESPEVATRAVDDAVQQLHTVERLMSIYRRDSQLARLNRHGVLENPHACLVEILRAAQQTSRRTGGAFDVTVQPLWTLCAESHQAGCRPTADQIEAAVQKVDWRRIEISPRRIALHGEGTAVTLNGIAQGFAADRAVAALRRHGIRHALVDTGEIGTLGDKADGQPWTVGIQHPRCHDAYVDLADLKDRCLATSGDYATTFTDDRRDNHLFDPRTGRSPVAFSSVTVAAPTALEADALSTAVSVLGAEDGLRLVRGIPGADAMVVLKDGNTIATEGFPHDA